MRFKLFNQPSEAIQYLGTPYTQDCIEAIALVLQFEEQVEQALVLTNDHNHCFLIKGYRTFYLIRHGFRSDYISEGYKGFVKALKLLQRHEVEIKELLITTKEFEIIRQNSLSDSNVESFLNSSYSRTNTIYDYISNLDFMLNEPLKINDYYPSELPLKLIDERIIDLAFKFKLDANASIMTAYTPLEDIIRKKINSQNFSSSLMEDAFCSDLKKKKLSPFKWEAENEEASNAIGRLFVNMFEAYRNQRAHSEAKKSLSQLQREFLLINELYLLEYESIKR
ncbi:MAG: TIGR02391 family protein [Acinetobacter sp.]